jgi:ABC-type transport system substrate-binding protein
MIALISASFMGTQVVSQIDPPIVPLPYGDFERFGPRVDKLTFKIAGSVSAEALMLQNGEIDLQCWSAPGTEWASWLANPDITMGEYMEMSMIYIAPNHARWPLGHGDQKPAGLDWSHFGGEVAYTGTHNLSDWPKNLEGSSVDTGGTADTYFFDPNCQRCLDARQYRRALAHLVNRDPIIAHMHGAGIAMETLIMPMITDAWENESAKMGTMYPYSLALAEQALAAGGFEDWDNDGTIEYSPGHNGAVVEELPSIEVYIRQDDPDRIFAGTFFTQQMSLVGIPNTPIITSNTICSSHVWQYPYDYDIYIEYWDWGLPMPDIYSEGFESSKDYYPDSWADNSVRYHNHAYDTVSDEFKYSATSADALAPCKKLQGILSTDAAVIPLYDYVGYMGARTAYGTFPGETQYAGLNWTGRNNAPGIGFVDLSNMLNMHPEGYERGGTLRHGLINDITDWNMMRTWWYYDLQILEQIYEYLIIVNPHNMTEYKPWLCESFEVGTWEHPTEGTCNAVNFTLIPGILWHDQEFLTVEDVGFSFEYNRDYNTMYYLYVEDFEEYVTYDTDPLLDGDETIELRYNVTSWLMESWVSAVPIVPEHIWADKNPATYNPESENNIIGTGPFITNGPDGVGSPDRVFGEFVYLEANPSYFRRLVRPDLIPNTGPSPWGADGEVLLDDFMQVVLQFGLHSGNWHSTWGPRCDVNKDRYVTVIDLTEVAVRYGTSGYIEGYPSYYM